MLHIDYKVGLWLSKWDYLALGNAARVIQIRVAVRQGSVLFKLCFIIKRSRVRGIWLNQSTLVPFWTLLSDLSVSAT